MKNILFIALCFLLSSFVMVHAESYYLQAVESAQLDAEKVGNSRDKVKEHKDVKVQDELEIPPFHKRDEWEKESLTKTFCTTCHLSPPHTKNLRSRAFLNMHTEFIACETCHMRPENVKFKYQWLDYRSKQVVKPIVERFRQPINREEALKKDKEEEVRKSDTLIKIAPFWENELALILRDHPYAEETGKIWKDESFENRIIRRLKTHVPLKKKGPECKVCHQTEEPMLDLKALGANVKQVRSMQRHIVPQFFKRYTEDEQKIRINNLLK